MSARLTQKLRDKVEIVLASAIPSLGYKAGQTIQLALSPGDVNIPEELETFLAGYKPFEFLSDMVSPPFLVDKSSDKYRIFDEDDAFEPADVETSTNARVKTVDPRSSLDDYRVKERALGTFISAAVQAESTFDIKARGTARVMNVLNIDRELRLWTLLTTAGNWATANKLTPADLWTDPIDGDPIADLTSMLEASAQPLNMICMNDIAGHVFLRHPAVRDYLKVALGDTGLQGTLKDVALGQKHVRFRIPSLEADILIAPARRKVSGVRQRILGNYVVGLRAPFDGIPTDAEDIKTVQTFRKKGASGTGFVVREYFVDEAGLEGGTMLVAGHAEDMVMLSDGCGFLISTVY